ncbi:MAG TPA: PepSY domain-containing protein [Fibrobacteria bacterium]|nr:PepSY domain-containing protein [Fibrobacteria bacterium]
MIALKNRAMALMAVVLTVAAANVSAYTGQELAKEAKFSMKQARQIALNAHPGRITDEELEREKGGTGLRYSFDILQDKVTQEVGIDAKTGSVLENAPEGPNPE